MDIVIAFKKYCKNIKIFLVISVLLLFTLFLINPFFDIYGGSLNLSYSLIFENIGFLFTTYVVYILYIIVYTIIQTIIIVKVQKDYDFNLRYDVDVRASFFELLKFNLTFYLIVYVLLSLFYKNLLQNNIIINILLFGLFVLFWFIPQIIIMEREKLYSAIIFNFNYICKNWIYLIYLLVTAFILVFVTITLDVMFGHFGGTIISTLFFVLFVIPFIEILKTEIYLDKYKLLKPYW